MRIVIPGGSGQVGRILTAHFRRQDHAVTVLSRHTPVLWNGKDLGPWISSIDGADVVINLTGRSVDCRYTQRNREEIKNSRIDSTRAIGQAIARTAKPPALWMNASTATIYRHALDRPMDERTGEIGGSEPNAPSTWRFSIDVATSWERAFFACPTPRTRKIALRSAMTMSPSPHGVFDVFLRLARLGLGGPIGPGNQFVSWIHDADFARALEFLIAHEELDGTVNVCSPNPLPNADFMRELRRAANAWAAIPTSRWMLEIGAFFLRTETELILKSRRVVPGRLLDAGFLFEYTQWSDAAKDLASRSLMVLPEPGSADKHDRARTT